MNEIVFETIILVGAVNGATMLVCAVLLYLGDWLIKREVKKDAGIHK